MRVLEGSIASGRLIAIYRRGDRVVGAVAVGAAKALRTWRAAIAERATWNDLVPSGA
jgi:hypothetical protein